MHAAIDSLTWVQRRSAAYATAKGVPEQHSTFKEARAAISALWKLVHPSTDFAEEPHVKAVAIGLRRTNPLLKAYSDTWDITIIFEHIFEMARRGEYLRDLPHYKMRPWLVALLKLRTSCRSGDIAPGKPPTGGALDERRGGVFRAFYP